MPVRPRPFRAAERALAARLRAGAAAILAHPRPRPRPGAGLRAVSRWVASGTLGSGAAVWRRRGTCFLLVRECLARAVFRALVGTATDPLPPPPTYPGASTWALVRALCLSSVGSELPVARRMLRRWPRLQALLLSPARLLGPAGAVFA